MRRICLLLALALPFAGANAGFAAEDDTGTIAVFSLNRPVTEAPTGDDILFGSVGQETLKDLVGRLKKASEDEVMEVALEAGAEDFKAEPEGYEVLTDPATFESVHRKVEDAGVECEGAEVTWLPVLTTQVSGDEATAVQKLIELLDEHDDVREVYSNAEFPVSES